MYFSILNNLGKSPSEVDYRSYGIEGKKFVNIEKPEYKWGLKSVGEMFVFFLKSRKPHKELPIKTLNKGDFSSRPSEFGFIWLGHSSIILEIDGRRLIIDPVLENASPVSGIGGRFQPSPLKREDLPEIDGVVISHDHYDHLEMETAVFFINRGTRFFVPQGVEARLVGWGCPREKITVLGWWGSCEFGDLKLTATPSRHFSGRSIGDRDSTLWCSWVIEGSKRKVFYSGDSGYCKAFEDIGNRFGPFDIAFMENGAWGSSWPDVHMTPEQSVQASIDLRSNKVVPVHWGVFDLALHSWDEPVKRVLKEAAKKGVNLIIPVMGQYTDPEKPETSHWWNQD